MMHQWPCTAVREHLEEFHDGELSLDERVAIQGHLGECVACRLAWAELADLGTLFRSLATAVPCRTPDAVARMSASVEERLQIAAQSSVTAHVRSVFQDMHFVWAGIGATVAMFICLAGSVGVLHAASSQTHPDSLAGVIALLANPGSNANPMRLDSEMMAPRAREGAVIEMSEEDAVFALAAVVTREGRIQNIEVLAVEQAKTLRVRPEVVLAMIGEASRAQFEPAQARGGHPVAVNMVWLLTNTTVVGRHGGELLLRAPWRAPSAQDIGPSPAAEPTAAPAAKPPAERLPLA